MNDLIRFSGQESSNGTAGGGAGSGGREETQVIELANGEDLIRELEGIQWCYCHDNHHIA